MSETIKLNALIISGETLTMYLRKTDGTLLNTGGSAMTEAGVTGVFTATLVESRAGLGALAVRCCVGTEIAANTLYEGWLNSDVTTIDDALATASAVTVIDAYTKKNATLLSGLVTGAGTGTEVFIGAAGTATITVDSSGNRSAVVWT